jgi:hypothetical protein
MLDHQRSNLRFEAIANTPTEVTECACAEGFTVVHAYAVSENLRTIQSFVMRPRVAPVAVRDKSSEPLNPGEYSVVLLGTVANLPFQLSTSRLWIPDFSISVPINDRASISLYNSLSLHFDPTLRVSAAYDHPRAAFDAGFATFDRFTKGLADVSVGFGLGSFKCGLCYSKKFGDPGFSFRLAGAYHKNTRTVSTVLNYDVRNPINGVVAVATERDKTRLGIAWHFSSEMSEFVIGATRTFNMSSLSVCLSRSGMLTSSYQRRLAPPIGLHLSSQIDLKEHRHGFGIRFVLE